MNPGITRRELVRSGLALAALALAEPPFAALGFAEPEPDAELIPFLDKQAGTNGITWEKLTDWITPNSQVYKVQHYNVPKINPGEWQLEIGGLVHKPRRFSLAELRSRKRRTLTATLECSGNSSSPGFMGAIGNVRWTGTPLASILRDCEPLKRGIEVAFFGTDTAKDELRKNEYTANFSRGLHITDALRDDVLLCYEMNGEPLEVAHGAPVRLIVPGWYGIAWVKWLSRIEVLDRRIMSKYMAREYVTLRAEERGEQTVWRETSIGPMLVKSIAARALRLRDGTVRLEGAAWSDGTPLAKVELRVDDGPWQSVTLHPRPHDKYCWTFWSFDWREPAAGEHTLITRATDKDGRSQPTPEDPVMKLKKTYWESNHQWARRIRV